MFRAFLNVSLLGAVLPGITISEFGGALVHAADRAAASAAQELVREALHREIYGLETERDELLGRAVQLEPNCAPARWHQGYVFLQGQWLRSEEIPTLASRDSRLSAYAELREQQPDNVAGNLRLANWCRQQQLSPQERAHLLHVLDLDPNHVETRMRLGYRRLEGGWVDEPTLRAAEERARRLQAAFAKWQPRLEKLRDQLSERSQKQREAATAAVKAIDDSEAIPALTSVLGPHSRDSALLVVETLGQMPDLEAAGGLATLAVLSPWAEVRSAAARQLGDRPQDHYVPLMLDAMYTPVVTSTSVVPVRTGGLMYRHQFLREGMDERQLLVLDTRYRRVPMPDGDRRETQNRAWLDSLLTAVSREQAVAQQNSISDLLNRRIADALNTATGQQLPPSPSAWWEWWNHYNSVAELGQKQTRTLQRSSQVAVVDRSFLPEVTGDGSNSGSTGRSQRVECFVAGTLVSTASGLAPIEKLRVGDLVLSQDIDSGELAYKPVTRTTVRPEEPLVEFRVENDVFRSTKGHALWISGSGWAKADEVRSGTQVHTLTGGSPVERSESAPGEAETFNLVVADFHTYFVGESRLLSHDVTPHQPTRRAVPGLVER
jgi:hypothetical protein